MLVKICGLTRAEDAAAAMAAGADLLGFIFVPGTPRAIDPDTALWIRRLDCATVGVFRNAALRDVLQIRQALSLDWVQLHGSEPDEWLTELGTQVLRRLPVAAGSGVDWQRVEALHGRCLPLIDPGAGDGVPCDWQALQPPAGVHFGLAGGLAPHNVVEAITAVQPHLVDVCSGVERAPGVKDPTLIETFVRAARGWVVRDEQVPGVQS